MGKDERATVVVLTALPEECQAVQALLPRPHTFAHPAGTRYAVAALAGTEWQLVLAAIGSGNQAAAALTERSISTFEPVAVLFVGIAGALRSDLRLGDVVVATSVYALHGGRDDPEGFRERPRTWPAPHELVQLAQEVDRSQSWISMLPEPARVSPPAVHFAAIAAGEVVLNCRSSALAQHLRDHCNDAVAIDTEDAGFAVAGHLNRATPALAIRGISDAADGDKDTTDQAGWRLVAARNAATFAVALAQQMAIDAEVTHSPVPTPTPPAQVQHVHASPGGVAYGVFGGNQYIFQPHPPTEHLR